MWSQDTVMAISSMKGTTDSEVAGSDLMLKYEQNVNQVLMPETMFLAVPSANL